MFSKNEKFPKTRTDNIILLRSLSTIRISNSVSSLSLIAGTLAVENSRHASDARNTVGRIVPIGGQWKRGRRGKRV